MTDEKPGQKAGTADGAATQQMPKVSARQPLSKAAASKPAGSPVTSNGQPTARAPQKPGGLSREEYARTVAGSVDATAVIPAIKDEPVVGKKGSDADGGSADAEKPAAKKGFKKPSMKFTKPEEKAAGAGAAAGVGTAAATVEAPVAASAAASASASTKVQPAVQTATQEDPASGSGRVATLRWVDPWSVTKLSFVVSVAMMIVSVVAVTVFWVVMNATGIWDSVNQSVTNVLSDNAGSFDITEYLGFARLVGLTLILSAVNVVLMTALATIAAHLYNLAAGILGGFRVTFNDESSK